MPTEWDTEAGEGPKKRGKLRRLRQEGERKLGQCGPCSAPQARAEKLGRGGDGGERCPKSTLSWAQIPGSESVAVPNRGLINISWV